jgi:hypothetical protein
MMRTSIFAAVAVAALTTSIPAASAGLKSAPRDEPHSSIRGRSQT